MASPREYFAALGTEDVGKELFARVEQYSTSQVTTQMYMRAALAFRYYFGFDPSGIHGTSGVLRGGEQGELAELRVNHARALVNTLLNLIISSKLVWTPKATNRDYESLRETELAAALLEYYWTDKNVERYASRAVEEAIAFCEGFIYAPWDESLGEDVAPDLESAGEDGAPTKNLKSGDLQFFNVSTWDVIRDPHKHSWEELDWVIVRLYRNKFDLAAQYPEQADKIYDIPLDLRALLFRTAVVKVETDDVPIYWFYHKRSPAVPNGRETLFLSHELVLHDAPLSYDQIPLHRVSPAELIATPFGYSPFMEVLGIQEVIDSLHTAITTNQSTFAAQNIIMEQGCEISIDQLAGGMRTIMVPPGRGETAVRPLQLTASPPEVFKYLDVLKEDQELLFGLNSVVRGTTPGSPKEMSGAALALLQSQALQQSSVLQQSYLRMVENVGTSIVQILQKNLSTPRQISITGPSSKYLVQDQTITGKSIGRIAQVKVEAGNPLSQSPAGRAQMAEQLIQMKLVTTPEQYEQVLSTGRLDPLTHSMHDELMLILSENEDIQQGNTPPVLIHDNAILHCKEHRSALASPNARRNPQVLKAGIDHIHQHYQAYYGNPPMVPMPMPPGAPPPPPGQPPQLVPEPRYRERMLFLMGEPPIPPPLDNLPPPMMMPPPPGAPGRPPGPPGPPPPPPPSQMPPGQNGKPPEIAKPPVQPLTGHKWDPQTGGGVVNP